MKCKHKKSLSPKRTTGISFFEILCLLFTGLLIEHKLYITLLLILMSFVHLRRLLTFPSSALLDFYRCVLKRFMTINLFHLIYLLIPLSPSQDTHSSGNAGGGPINFYDYLFLSERRGTPRLY